MATSSPSPTSPLAVSPTSTVTPPPQPSTPAPDPPTVTNSNPPNSSIPLTPPPTQATSPPLASPPPLDTPSPPPPTDPSTPPAPATSPPPPTATPSSSPPPPIDAPPSSTPASPPIITVSPPPPTPVNTPLTSPPPPAVPPPSTGTPSGPSPPSDPPSSPPPPATNPKSSPPSTLHPPYSSPPPPHSKTQQPPPPGPQATSPPPPSTKSVHRPTSAPPSPESSPHPPSPGPPNASPSKNSSSPSSPISLNAPLLSPPPPLSPTPGSHIPSSAPNPFSGNSTASPPRKGGVSEGGVVAIGVVVGIVMLGLIGMVVLYISKRRQRTSNGGYVVPSPYGSSPRSDSNLLIKTQGSTPFGRSGSGSGTLSPHSLGGLGQSRSWFTYQELYEATNGFALGSLLGEGGFGVVYKGVLTNGREVAVKQLKTGGGEGEREFRSEVETISRIHHRHLVSLVGYCIYENQRLLVYEYVPNQTLHYHLHGEDRPVMDWATRIKIAKGAARGIAYLHEDCHPRIIHRDIKSSNILIDSRFEARVSDFGTARLALDADTHISTRVMGTFGYMAPEYATSGKLTDKSDVYSFGVVLLELITGRKPVDESQPIGDESLVEWARPLLSHVLETGQVEGLVDPRLEKNYVESELILMIEAAAACVRHMATKRPQMGQIVRAFDGLSPSDLSNGMRVGQSEIYDSAQQSVDIRWFRRMAFGSHGYSTDYFSEATRNTGHSNPTQIDQGAGFSAQQGRNDPSQQGAGISTQQSRNDPSLQQSQNIYFSSQRTQSLAFSGQWSQNPSVFKQSSQNPISRQQSSQNLDSSSRQSESS